MAYDLTTKAEVKKLLDISNTTWDDTIDKLITSVSAFLQNYCDALFDNDDANKTQYFDGGVQTLTLEGRPISSVVSVGLRSGDLSSPSWSAYSAYGDYIVDLETGKIHFVFILPKGFNNIRVVYKGGYDEDNTIPKDLQLAAEQLVIAQFNKRKSHGIKSESVGGASINWQEAMDPVTVQMLAPYRNLSL